MKKLTRIFLFQAFSILVILGCTKDIDLRTEVEFTVMGQHRATGYVEEGIATTVTVVPEEVLEEFSYSWSYEVLEGEGRFEDIDGNLLKAGEAMPLEPYSASAMYLGVRAGEHKIKVIASDNYGFTEEIELEYILEEVPPVVWTATSPVKRMELGNSATITVVFEKSELALDVEYERSYIIDAGSGTLTTSEEESEIAWDTYEGIVPGTFTLAFTPDELGSAELSFNLKGDDGEEYVAELSFDVLTEIIDEVAPEIELLGDEFIVVEVGSTYVDAGATATDDVDGDITANLIIDTSDVDTTTAGTYTVTFNVNDSSNNPADTKRRTVEVVAGENPQSNQNDIIAFAIPGQTGPASIDESEHTIGVNLPFGSDVEVSPTTLTISANASVTPAQNVIRDFGNPVNYAVTSEDGTVQVWTVNLTVNEPVDSEGPVISLTGANPQSVEVGAPYVELGATANDDFDGDVTDQLVIDASALNTSIIGEYLVTYDVTDTAGNQGETKVRTVRVADTTAPVITLSGGDLQIPAGQAYLEPGYAANDNYDGNITGSVIVGGNVDYNAVGSYTLTYDVDDAAGNTADRKIRVVEVTDQTPPEITLVGNNVIMEAGDSFNDPGYMASDNIDGDITGNVIVNSTNLNTNVVGTYTITYNVADAQGNPAPQVSRIVEVRDTTPPTILLTGGTVTFGINETYLEPGFSANDSVDGNITGDVVVGGNLNMNALGTYTVTYNVSDNQNNDAIERTRTVIVVDRTIPVITLSGGNVSMKAYNTYVDPGYSATDNIDGNITGQVVRGGNLDTSAMGTYTVTYNVADNAGNNAVQRTRSVEVLPRETFMDWSTGIYTAPAGSSVTVNLTSGGSGSGDGSISGGGGNASTCWGRPGCNGTDSYTFIMPSSGSVSFTGSHSSSDGSSGTSVSIESNDETHTYSMNNGAAGNSIPTN